VVLQHINTDLRRKKKEKEKKKKKRNFSKAAWKDRKNRRRKE